MKTCLRLVIFGMVLACLASSASAQQRARKTGLTPEDWKYTMPAGVTMREVHYFSDGIACYAKIFFPKDFKADGKTPGIVLGQGWAGSHFSIDKYGARFAERGFVAMTIDYRGWGDSDSFISQAQPTVTASSGDNTRDNQRFTSAKLDVVLTRTRLLPLKQVEDYRNAISYLQGEPGVDRDRIGIWGSSFAGGHVITVAGQDARVKAIASQIPGIGGRGSDGGPVNMRGNLLEDAIKRARTGRGAEFETGFSTPRRMVDVETNQVNPEYRPFLSIPHLGNRPILFVAAERDELCPLSNIQAAHEAVKGPKKIVVVPEITHFEMYINEPFEVSSNAAADWFKEHLMGSK